MLSKNTKKTNEKNNVVVEKVYTVPSPSDSIEELELGDEMDVVMEKHSFKKIVRNIDKGKIVIDKEFQRDAVYRVLQKSSIINSTLEGKSIPPLYAFEERDGNNIRLSIIDGQQRLLSVYDFMTSQYALSIPYGKYKILNNVTYEQIQKLNPTLADEIGDRTLDINVIRNITKEEAQEYFGLINTTSVPLSPGEKLWSLHDPVKTVLKTIVGHEGFKIINLRKTRKGEYLIATKLLWNRMFLNSMKHEFVGDKIQEFVSYFNTVEDIDLLEKGKKEVIEILKTYSQVIRKAQYAPRTQRDLYNTLCFISTVMDSNKKNIPHLSTFINWVFKGINKQIYPMSLKNEFDILLGNRVDGRGRTSSKDFVITLENLFYKERKVWLK